jgi:hypothetical protein
MGAISGVVVDSQTSRPVAGAEVQVRGETSTRATTDISGKYTVSVPPGTYQVVIVSSDFLDVTLSDVVVEPGGTTDVSTVLTNKALVTTVEVVERATAVGATAEYVLQERKLAPIVSDSLGREELAASTSGDAAGALQQVTGVSVVGEGFVYVRGLGERYSATELNGAIVPTTEPEKRVVPLDLFPTGLIESIKIAKSYSPDLPAEFSGGLVQMTTMEFPAERGFTVSYKTAFNTMTSFSPFLTYGGGPGDYFGFGSGARAVPSVIPRDLRIIPGRFTASHLQAFGRAFSNNWAPNEMASARPASDWSVSGGGTWGRFGLVGAVSLSNKLQQQNETQRYLRMGAGEPIVFTDYPVYREYSENARLGAVFNAAVRLSPNNKLIIRNTLTHDAEKSVRRFAGYDGGVANELAAERLRYIERSLFSTGVAGEHNFPSLRDSLIHWQFTYSRSTRDEPDLREVFRNKLDDGRYVFSGTSTSGLRFFSGLQDRIYEPQVDYGIPFFKGAVSGLIKFGARATMRSRDFGARRFLFQLNQSTVDLFLPSNDLFAPANIRPDAFQLIEYTRATDAYDASMDIYAGYGMVDMGFGARWRVVAGIRVEDAKAVVNTLDNLSTSATPVRAVLQNRDPVPAANFIYALTPRQNLRLSVSRTLSRPDFRELSPFDFANTLGGYITAGNPNLKRAVITNYDGRWEWFTGGNQLVAFSVFAKTFTDPIEQVIVPSNDLRQTFVNAKGALNFGGEVEFRRSLASFSPRLRDFGVAANVTFVDSNIDLRPEDAAVLTSHSRPLLGQSRYVANAVVGWQRRSWRSSARFSVNYVSRRISDVGTFGLPDIYQEANTLMDFSYQYYLGGTELEPSFRGRKPRQQRFPLDAGRLRPAQLSPGPDLSGRHQLLILSNITGGSMLVRFLVLAGVLAAGCAAADGFKTLSRHEAKAGRRRCAARSHGRCSSLQRPAGQAVHVDLER